MKKHPVLRATMSDYKNNMPQATARAVIGMDFSISMFTFHTQAAKDSTRTSRK